VFDLDFANLGEVQGIKESDTGGNPSSDDDDQAFRPQYSVDAWHFGNLSRFINHCCVPNVQLRCCYIDEGDDTKPLLAMFATSKIHPGEQVTINYTGIIPTEEDVSESSAGAESRAKGRPPKGQRNKPKGGKGKTTRQPARAKVSVNIVADDGDDERNCFCGELTM